MITRYCLTPRVFGRYGFHLSHARTFASVRDINPRIDYYKLMGENVDMNSSAQDIRKQYFMHAKQCHPDTTFDLPKSEQLKLEKKFISISKAYEILSDKKLRKIYNDKRNEYLIKLKLSDTYNSPDDNEMIDPKEFQQSFYRRMKSKHNDHASNNTYEESIQWWDNNNNIINNYDKNEYKIEREKWRKKITKDRPFSSWDDDTYKNLIKKYSFSIQKRKSILSMIKLLTFIFISMYIINIFNKNTNDVYYGIDVINLNKNNVDIQLNKNNNNNFYQKQAYVWHHLILQCYNLISPILSNNINKFLCDNCGINNVKLLIENEECLNKMNTKNEQNDKKIKISEEYAMPLSMPKKSSVN